MSRHFFEISALAMTLVMPVWAEKNYTREEAVKTALENSSNVKTAEEELKTAISQVDGGYGRAYPSIDLNANITRIFGLDDVTKSTGMTDAAKNMADDGDANKFDTDVLAPTLDGLMNQMKAQGYRWQSSVGLTATQILYAAGQVGTGIEIAKVAKKKQEVNLENTKTQVRYDVEKAFNELIVLDSTIAITKASIDLVQGYVNVAEQSYKSGTGTELDVIRAQIQLDELNSTIEMLNKKVVLARNSLLNTMGLSYDPDVKFSGELRTPDSKLPYPDTAMANVLKRRKEIAMLDAGVQMAEKNIEINRAGYKPTVALVGGLTYNNNQNEFYKWNAPDWDKNIDKYIALSVTMNLFNGMQTRENVVQAKSTLRSVQIQKESAERGFRVQVESCVRELSDAENQLANKKRSVDLARRNLELTEAAFGVGRETQINLLTASNGLRSAQREYLNAVLNWNNAYNALLQATGEF